MRRASGAVDFQVAAAGKVAFDSHGDLVIGGAFAGRLDLGGGHVLATTGPDDHDGFVVDLDATGAVVFARSFGDAALPVNVPGFGEVASPRDQTVAGVAVGPNDEIAVTGAFRYEMDLGGTTVTNVPSFPSGSEAGTFVVTLAANGAPIYAVRGPSANAGVQLGGIAIRPNGDVVVSSNTPADPQGPFAFPQLTVYAAHTGDAGLSHFTVSRALTSQCIDMIWQYAGVPSDSNSAPLWWFVSGAAHVPSGPMIASSVSMSGFAVDGPQLFWPQFIIGNSAPDDCGMPPARR